MNLRVGLAYFFSLVAFVVFASHRTGSVFPWLPIGLFGGALIVLALDTRLEYQIAIAGTAATGFVAYVFWFAHPSLLNMDPDKVAVAISRVIELGGIDGMSNYVYYTSIPAFHVFVSSAGILLGISATNALILFGVVTPLVQILGAAALVNTVSSARARTYAIVVAMSSTAILYYAVSPIPQLSAAVLWMPFLLMFDKYIRTRSKSHLIGILVITLTLVYTHKLAMAVTFGVVISASAVHIAKYIISREIGAIHPIGVIHPYLSLSILTGFLFILQNFWLTTFGRTILIEKVPELFDERVGAPTSPDTSAFLAANPLSRPHEILVGSADWVLITALAGVCWLILLRVSLDRLYRHTVLLGASMFLGGLVLMSFLAPEGVAPRRVILFVTIPFAATIGVAFSAVFDRLQGRTTHILTGVVILLLVSQLFVTGAVPDHSYEPREYLTPQEVDGKKWSNEHVTAEVHADFFYAREIVDFDRPGQTYVTGEGAEAKGYSAITIAYLNGTVAEQGHAYVLYRTMYERYQVGGTWVLTWDPESELDSVNNRVFDNGGAVLYENPS